MDEGTGFDDKHDNKKTFFTKQTKKYRRNIRKTRKKSPIEGINDFEY